MLLRRPHHEANHGAINVTPLIDVVMCLIIFYLLVGQLATARHAPMRLPTASSGLSQIEPSVLTIELEPGADRIRVAGEPMAMADLQGALAAQVKQTPGLAVQLRADRDAPYERLRPVLEACRNAGLSTLRLAATRPSAGAGTSSDGATPR